MGKRAGVENKGEGHSWGVPPSFGEPGKSGNTIEKYIRDVKRFLLHAGSERPEREMVLAYKSSLKEQYQLSSANSMLMAVNHYLKYKGLEECRVSAFRQQRKIFSEESRQLSRKEYERLVLEARKSLRGELWRSCGCG